MSIGAYWFNIPYTFKGAVELLMLMLMMREPLAHKWDKQPLISGAGWSNEVVQWQAGRSSTSGGIISLYGHPPTVSIGSIFLTLSREPWCKGKQVEQETV